MKNLKEYLIAASQAYYAGEPILSDAEYDRLEAILGEQLLIGEKDIFQPHMFRMYSLAKHYPEKDGTHFLQTSSGVVESPKLDGAAISLLKNGDSLIEALTRGDGITGRPITDKISQLSYLHNDGVNLSAENLGVHQVTGELVASIDVPNSRNAASGSLGLLTGFKERADEIGLVFVAYDIVGQNIDCKTYSEKLNLLHLLGYETIKTVDPSKYPTDGTVLRIDSMQEFDNLGHTHKAPRGAVAIKEVTETKSTKLLDVVWQTGGSGRITPVAILETIELGGANVSRATLNNIGYIRTLDLRIGDTVDVVRAGEIIPKVVGKSSV